MCSADCPSKQPPSASPTARPSRLPAKRSEREGREVMRGPRRTGLSGRQIPPRLEDPAPGRRLVAQVLGAAELVPGQPHLPQPHPPEAGPAQPVAHLEWLPEVLLQPPVAELAEGEVVPGVLGVVGGVLARLRQ